MEFPRPDLARPPARSRPPGAIVKWRRVASSCLLLSLAIPTPAAQGTTATAPKRTPFVTRATLSSEQDCLLFAPLTLGAGIPVSKTSGSAVPDDDWADGFNWPGMTGEVRAFTVFEGGLVAGGNFAYAGPRLCNGIARRNGDAWESFGSGFDDAVEALTLYDNQLVAGGAFQLADGNPVEQLALWTGTQWKSLGPEPTLQEDGARVRALAIYGGNLVVGGRFTRRGDVACNNIALWDGSAWHPLGGGMTGYPEGGVTALAVYQGKLVAAGHFTHADGSTARYIAQWDGVHWAPLGFGLLAAVQALYVFRDELIVAGWFDYAGGYPAQKVASWNGSAWTGLGDGFGPGLGIVYALAEYDSLLIAGGLRGGPPGAPQSCIGAWDGHSWRALGTGLERGGFQIQQVRALAPFGTDLVAGGDFSLVGGVIGVCIATWTGQEWRTHTAGNGIDGGFVQSLADYQGKVIAGGEYWGAGTLLARNVAAWDGSAWGSVGTGTNGRITAVASVGASFFAGPRLFAGGFFTEAGGVPATHVTQWDGTAWSALGDGLEGPVYAFAPFAGGVVAGGFFTASGSSPVAYIGSWDGSKWHALGGGMDNTVTSSAVRDSELFAAGFFTVADGKPAQYIARWDGQQWSALGAGLPWPIYTLALQNGKLVAGGENQGPPRSLVWEWDGTTWSPVGQLQYLIAQTLATHQGELFVAGEFSADPSDPSSIARRVRDAWQSLGSGINRNALVLSLCSSRGSLYASGLFDTAGNKVAIGIARWNGAVVPVAVDDLRAAANAQGVRLSWRVAVFDESGFQQIDVQRADSEAGPYENRGTLLAQARSEQSFDDAGLHPGHVYWYRLELRSPHGASQFVGPVSVAAAGSIEPSLAVAALGGRTPVEIRFDVGRTATPAFVAVYSITGREVRVLRHGVVTPGPQLLVWDGRDAHGHAVARGTYWVQLQVGARNLARKVAIFKR